MIHIRRFLISGVLAATLATGALVPAAPALALGELPCEAISSSNVGRLISFSGLPERLVAGDDLEVTLSIDCPGSPQAVLMGLNLGFTNDQGLQTTFSPRSATLLATEGTVKTYGVAIPTADGALPEGRQILTSWSRVMRNVPSRPGGGTQPTYLSSSKYYYAEQLNLPPEVRMTVWNPTHTAPHPQLAERLLAGATAEIRMPAWGAGATLTYRWETENGTVLSTQRDFVPALETDAVRVVVTGVWPDGTVSERRSRLSSVGIYGGGFTDITLSGEAVPHGGMIVAQSGNGTFEYGSGWYRLDSLGQYRATPVTRSSKFEPIPEDVGERFQFILGSRGRGASPIVTVTAALPPGDRRTGYVHQNVVVNSVSELSARLQPGYKLTANNPWPSDSSSYRWFKDGKVVAGATRAEYTLTLADVGHTLQGAVATDIPGYSPGEVRTSTVRIPLAKLNSGNPQLKGAERVGAKLTVTKSGWTKGAALSYQWMRNNKIISGATTSTYTIPSRDLHAILKVRVTGKLANHTTITRTSHPTVLVDYGKLTTAVPSVTGTTKSGKTLVAKTGKWTAGTSFRYEWLRSGKVIKGANRASLRLGTADKGRKIAVRVSGVQRGYMGASRTAPSRLVSR